MALLPNITYSPGEPMEAAFDKMNAAIDAINEVLGGGTIGQQIRKASGTDFDYEFVDSLKWKVIEIGTWNMTSGGKTVNPGIASLKKIRVVKAIVRNDGDSNYLPLDYYDSFTDQIQGGIGALSPSFNTISLSIKESGLFDDADFSSTAANRGWVTIGYID